MTYTVLGSNVIPYSLIHLPSCCYIIELAERRKHTAGHSAQASPENVNKLQSASLVFDVWSLHDGWSLSDLRCDSPVAGTQQDWLLTAMIDCARANYATMR